jgi:hypothetical protein
MTGKISSIQVSFPVPVDVPDEDYRELMNLISRICKRYERQHPDRVMWPAGIGGLPVFIPMTAEEEKERGPEFDMSVLSVDCSEREKYHDFQTYEFSDDSVWKTVSFCRHCRAQKTPDNEFDGCRGRPVDRPAANQRSK